MCLVQQGEHRQNPPRIEVRGRVFEAEKAERTHRVAGVDCPCDAVRTPQRRAAVTQLVAILDVVVHERIIVEDLDRNGCVERVLDRSRLTGGNSHHHLWAQPLAAPRRAVWRIAEVA